MKSEVWHSKKIEQRKERKLFEQCYLPTLYNDRTENGKCKKARYLCKLELNVGVVVLLSPLFVKNSPNVVRDNTFPPCYVVN